MKLLCNLKAAFALLVFTLCLPVSTAAQSTPNVPEQYKRLFFQYADKRSLYEKALNSIGLTHLPIGRSCALIAGVTQYPNFTKVEQSLKPAEVDIEKLESYLKDQEFFDEIVVLKDGDMTLDNLDYFLRNYFPDRLAHFAHCRFLFAYSGHGYAEIRNGSVRGGLLKNSATSLKDLVNSIDLSVVRTLLDPIIGSAEKVLVLINSCHSGAFFAQKSITPNQFSLGKPHGAYAIMASRSSESSLQLESVGPGSVFFEEIFVGLKDVADVEHNGRITCRDLASYLRREIPKVTDNGQTPKEGDLIQSVSESDFFFLNRSLQVHLGNVKEFNPGNAVTFGTRGADALEQGRAAYRAGHFEKAFPAFIEAATAGNADGMNGLGYLYELGQGVPQDIEQARQWYEKAVAAGNASGMNNIGNLYYSGHGVKKDLEQARLWYEKAAAAGNANAMFYLGLMHELSEGVKQDHEQAWQWFEKAAAAGDARGMNYLGFLYNSGRGVMKDLEQARLWYEKAAAAGNASAMFNLGLMYELSEGVKQDHEQAWQWFEKAAAAGNADAMNSLGIMYELGQGVKQDYEQARQWYRKAAAARDKNAAERLKKIGG